MGDKLVVVASSRPDVEKAMSRPFTAAQAPASRPGEDVVSQWAAKAWHRPLLRGSSLWVQSPAPMHPRFAEGVQAALPLAGLSLFTGLPGRHPCMQSFWASQLCSAHQCRQYRLHCNALQGYCWSGDWPSSLVV